MYNNKVLIVDDDRNILNIYREILSDLKEEESLQPETFSDGKSLLKYFAGEYQKGNRIPLCILNINMPGTDGLDTAGELRKTDPHVVIIITGQFDVSLKTIKENLKKDIYYIRKPFNKEEFFCLTDSLIKGWKKDFKLVRYEEHLEQITEERTRELTKANKELEQEIKKRIEKEKLLCRYEQIISTVQDPLSFIGKDYTYKTINNAYLKLTGKPREALTGKTAAEFVGEDFFEEKMKPYLDIALSGREISYKEWFDLPAGRVYGYVKYYPYLENDGTVSGVITSVTDITEIKKAEENLKYRLAIEKLVTSISTRFININLEEIEEEINNALHTVGKFVGADICSIFLRKIKDEKVIINNIYEWCEKGIPSRKEKLLGLDIKPYNWLSGKILNFEDICICSLSELPPDAEKEKAVWKSEGILSVLGIPIKSRNSLVGSIIFNTLKEEKKWKKDDLRFLKMTGEIFVNLLEKKEYEEKLGKHRQNLEKIVNERTKELELKNKNLQREIDKRKKMNKALKKSESKFRNLSKEYYNLLETIPDRVVVISPEFKLLWSNTKIISTPEQKNRKKEKCQGLIFNCLTPCKNCPAVKCFYTEKEERENIITADSQHFDVIAIPVKNEESKIEKALIVARDITEKIFLQKDATRTASLALVGELAAGVAHEINNPLTVIINYGQILSDTSQEGTKENDIAGRIIKEGERIASIVKNLSFFANPQLEQKRKVKISEIISDAMTLSKKSIRKNGIKININLPENMPEIIVHPVELLHVFLNILSNAQIALNKKHPKKHENKIIEISAEEILIEGNPFVRMIFYDNGCGISEEIIDKVINPFFTTEPPGKATGLGLSISYGIIEAHRGKISLESKEGFYTKVRIDLPGSDIK